MDQETATNRLEQLDVDERVFVRIEPGAPGDFEPGAELLGVPGEPVSAVGDELTPAT